MNLHGLPPLRLSCPDMLLSNPFSDSLNLYRDTVHTASIFRVVRDRGIMYFLNLDIHLPYYIVLKPTKLQRESSQSLPSCEGPSSAPLFTTWKNDLNMDLSDYILSVVGPYSFFARWCLLISI